MISVSGKQYLHDFIECKTHLLQIRIVSIAGMDIGKLGFNGVNSQTGNTLLSFIACNTKDKGAKQEIKTRKNQYG